jgi:hypothetical protein
MKKIFYFFSLSFWFTLTSILLCSDAMSQGNLIIKGTVNVRQIVDLRLQRPLSEQVGDELGMEEREHPRLHAPSTERIHYAKEYKSLNESQNIGQPSPSPQIGFASKSYDGYYPPDPHGAVSEHYIVGTVNDELYIQDRSGNLLSDTKLLNFWAPVHQTTRLFDPRLVYDPNTQTWMLVTAANPQAGISRLLIAISQSEDPMGIWNLYNVPTDSAGTLWADYPNIAFNKKWVVITANMFGDTTDMYDTGRVFLFDRSELMNGLTPSIKIFGTDQGVEPAVTYDSSMNDLYLMETYTGYAGQLQLFKISGAVGSEQMTSVGFPAIHMTWSPIPPGDADFAPQRGDTNKIQCNDDRMGSVIFKNNLIWGTHVAFLPGGDKPTRSSIIWWAIDTNAEVVQSGMIDHPAGKNFYAFSSIAVNKYNDALIGYAVFGADRYASMGYSYHDHAQPAGSTNDPYIAKDGENTYSRSAYGRTRWGDCSATVIDPLNDIDFWTIGEYAESTANNWGTWWTKVNGLDTVDHNPSAFSLSVDLVPNPNKGSFNLYFTGQVHGSVQLDIYDMLGQRLYTTTDPDPQTSAIWISTFHGYFTAGIYIVRIKANGQTIDKKMLVHY